MPLDLTLLPDGGVPWLAASGEHADIVRRERVIAKEGLQPRERQAVETEAEQVAGGIGNFEFARGGIELEGL